ncbi:phosphoenolpyruvate--protein phosphotransferase [Neglectibacter caecimuris]|uniref:phosphoenolpyruvate--protein phosphotransferase n=1 Tax=Neglectibacter caecimuris TaxID=3093658 RepID=UPI002AC9C0D9|nr:phosphoenolpyruvate--protein phosphotransferase [Neglectibacter sp. M00184]
MGTLLHGIAASPGIGMGRVFLYHAARITAKEKPARGQAEEWRRYRHAVKRFCGELRERAARLAPVAGQEQADILLSQVAMARDPALEEAVKARIASRQSAEAALDAACAQFIGSLLESESEVIRLRAADVRDLRDRLLRILLGLPETDFSALPPDTVLIADSLPPSAMTALISHPIAAIVFCKDGKASHSVILARAMEIPTVVETGEVASQVKNGEWAVVDGTEGTVLFSPTAEELQSSEKKREIYLQSKEALNTYIGHNAVTADQLRIRLTAGVGSEGEIRQAGKYGCDGVGLLRSEFLYLDRSTLPGEEEQFRMYTSLVRAVGGKPLVIRTLDIGGDKRLPGLFWEQEENPFLGCRGVRLYREQEEMFRTQLKAILRAGAYGDVRLMIPMITGVEELRWVKKVFAECKEELRNKGESLREDMPLGAMVETAAAALTVELLAEESDFLSIGMNDLTQYILAVDRDNVKVSHLYSHYDPALLRSLQRIFSCGRETGIPISVCGQAAADPLFLPLLLGLGAEELNVQPSFLLPTRRALSQWTKGEASLLAEQALKLKTEAEVCKLLEENRR